MSTQTMQTVADFVRKYAITMTAKPADRNPNMPIEDKRDVMIHWLCEFTRTPKSGAPKRQMITFFSTGSGHNGKMPAADEVLDCLASDSASAVETFEDWCSEYGYDSDSRKAEATWKICKRQAAALRDFLGTTPYQQLLFETERQ